MIRRITIQNYMAHKDTVLELGHGVTVLTGPNNTGKSAVVEALRSLAQNPPPQHVIRHGASQAVVRAELDSGEIIEWVRSKGSTIYNLYRPKPGTASEGHTKETYAKFGRTPPDDIRRLLRLDLVETENGAIDIHIGNQRYPIFLLDQTGSQAAGFFAASTEAEYLLRMQQMLKTRTDRARSRRKELLQENEELERQLKRFLPLDGIEETLTVVEADYSKLNVLQNSLPVLERTIHMVALTEAHHSRKSRSCSALQFLGSPPEPLETRSLEKITRDLSHTESGLTAVGSSSEVLKELATLPTLSDTVRMDFVVRALTRDSHSLRRLNLASGAMEELEDPPAPYDTWKLKPVVANLEGIQKALIDAKNAELLLEKTEPPPQIKENAPLLILIWQWEAHANSLALCSALGEALGEVMFPPEPQPTDKLAELITALQESQARYGKIDAFFTTLSRLAPCGDAGVVGGLEESIQGISQLQSALEETERRRQEIARALNEKRGEIEDAIQVAGACPLCGNTLDMVHFLEAAHG